MRDLHSETAQMTHAAVALPSDTVKLQELLELAELYRADATRRLNQDTRAQLGQFLTPLPVATRLAALFQEPVPSKVVILEPGAGVGTLLIAAVGQLLGVRRKPQSVHLVAYEIDLTFLPFLRDILERLCALLDSLGIAAEFEIRNTDFVAAATASLENPLFSQAGEFTHVILNPPFRKIGVTSGERLLLQRVGIECSNLYAAFVWLAAKLLAPGGQLAAITPRSFCNGPYFRPFRLGLIQELALDNFLLIEERNLAFSDDDVLQETVLFHGVRGEHQAATVEIQTASGPQIEDITSRKIAFSQLVDPHDPEQVFHLVGDQHQAEIKREMESLPCSLDDLGLQISTGRVVDFRAKEFLRDEPETQAVPLIYPLHLREGSVRWPVLPARKPNALMLAQETESLLVPMGHYVLLKRFTSKEEKRRVVATVFSPLPEAKFVGFENHLNYFHARGAPLPVLLAHGLAAFLNSSALDDYFRQFSGHTQVNATDLRGVRFPSLNQLTELGKRATRSDNQASVDAAVSEVLNFMPESKNALAAGRRVAEALEILRAVGASREQLNERSALVVLALAGISPDTPWASASAPLLGITEMMDFFRDAFEKSYKPNSRETVRRFSVHQFVQMGLIVENPDKPRPVNSPNFVYQIEPTTLSLLKLFGSPAWSEAVAAYKISAKSLVVLRAKEREMLLMPVTLPSGKVVQLSSGGQNEVIKALLEHFCPRFTPGGHVLYLGDAGEKWIVNESAGLAKLGIVVDSHGKMPDLVIHFTAKNWLVLVEAVTTHGPMNLKRKNELRKLFGKSSAGLVFVTAFPTRAEMVRFLGDISWETEVWVAEAPSHMIHFNGERFLGPYDV